MALPSGCLPSGCLNPRWAPSHHLFASAAHASALEGLSATVYTHTLPPRLLWGGHAVYEYRSKAECLAVLGTNSAADFLMPSGRLMTDESKGELLDQIFRERQRADALAFEMGKENKPSSDRLSAEFDPFNRANWKWFHGPPELDPMRKEAVKQPKKKRSQLMALGMI